MNTSSINNEKEIKILKTDTVLKETIVEDDKLIKYLLNLTILGGALGFFIIGLSSYIKYDIIPFLKADQIVFFPQGLTMCFYGLSGTIIGINQIRIMILKVGEGYNEFNKTKGIMKIYRKGVSGEKSDVNITYPLEEIEAIKIEIKTELFNTRQNIYVCIKGKNDIPIIQIDKPLKITELERKASEIASFLKIPVKGI